MATYTLKIDKRNKAAKALIELMEALPFIEIVENKPGLSKPHKETHYNPDFVKMVKDSYKNDNRVKISIDNLWGNLD